MFKVLLPSGKLVIVESVEAMVEGGIMLNGGRRNLVDVCRSLKYNPTALCLTPKAENGSPFNSLSGKILIGNLDSGYVKSILYSLLSQGYYSFADLKCQKVRMFEEAVIDGGKSAPYIIENYFMTFFERGSVTAFDIDNINNAETPVSEEDWEDEDAEYDEYDAYSRE